MKSRVVDYSWKERIKQGWQFRCCKTTIRSASQQVNAFQKVETS